MYSDNDLKSALQEATEIIGYPPTITEYKSLDLDPSEGVIRHRFGSWDDCLIEAGVCHPDGTLYAGSYRGSQ